MQMCIKPTIKQILTDHRPLWDNAQTRPVVRENFQKVLDCRTMKLGAEVYASDSGERKSFPHTCKSRACSSCGQRATLTWQREVAARLPDIPFAGVNLTMPDVFWPILQRNRLLLDDLPAIGAGVVQDWAEQKFGAQVAILVVRHTFGAHLNFNAHLHILVSTVGLHMRGDRLVTDIRFYRDAIVKRWRDTLLDYLAMALDAGLLFAHLSRPELKKLLEEHRERWWSAKVDYFNSKGAFLRYISRYLRRPPLAEYRLLSSDNDQEVRFLTKDKKIGRTITTTCTIHEFITCLADQVPDRYRHGVRYFGLLAPQSICKNYEVFLALLGQRRPPRPKRIRWAASIQKTFGQDPLLDSSGQRMYLVGRVSPARAEPI
jgi:hypothetical protein